MKRLFRLFVALPLLAALMFAQPARESQPRPQLNELAATIRTELESHGERVLGRDAYRWSTRLEKITDCRAEFSVRVTSNLGETIVRTESVSFSLGAIEPYAIGLQKHWLELPCGRGDKCILSTSTCRRTTAEGIVIDCTTASQKREDSFLLQLDDDAGASSRLERAFHQAANLCREPIPVTF